MDFRKTEEQELLIKSLTELVQREVPESYQQEIDENAAIALCALAAARMRS